MLQNYLALAQSALLLMYRDFYVFRGYLYFFFFVPHFTPNSLSDKFKSLMLYGK